MVLVWPVSLLGLCLCSQGPRGWDGSAFSWALGSQVLAGEFAQASGGTAGSYY